MQRPSLHHYLQKCTFPHTVSRSNAHLAIVIRLCLASLQWQLKGTAQPRPHLKTLSWALESDVVARHVIQQDVTICLHDPCADILIPRPAAC